MQVSSVEEGYSRPGWLPRAIGLIPGRLKGSLARAAISSSRRRRRTTFRFNGLEYPYFFHPYNLAWRNERTVEIPIISAIVGECNGEVLEVGNVMSHYLETHHDIIDRYESEPGVTNQDVTSFNPEKEYELIVSISTLEHIGWTEHPRDPEKGAMAIAHLQSLLAPGGRLIATIPVGLNEELDRRIEQGEIRFTELKALGRISHRNEWEEIDCASAWRLEYSRWAYRANAVVVCCSEERLRKPDERLSSGLPRAEPPR